MKTSACRIVIILSLVLLSPAFAPAASIYFPISPGNSWTYNSETLTLSGEEMVLKSGTEAVEILSDGRLKTFLTLSNGNTVESYNSYSEQDQALYVTGTVITIKTVDLPYTGYTESISTNSYAPPLLVFPSATTQGTQETSSSTQSTHVTGTGCVMGFCAPLPTSDTTSQHTADITVGAIETVTVPAGTFSALKIVTILTVTEEGTTNAMTLNEWYAPNVGLVKLDSPNLKRQLASYSVSGGTTRELTVTLMGSGGGSVNSEPSGFSCDSGTCSESYAQGTSLTLHATANADSLFNSWGGDCTGSGPCSVTMTQDRTVTATFAAVPPLRMGGAGYSTLQGAFDEVNADSVVQARYCAVIGDATLDSPWTVLLEGGYDKNFDERAGETVLRGMLTLAQGTLVADHISIQ